MPPWAVHYGQGSSQATTADVASSSIAQRIFICLLGHAIGNNTDEKDQQKPLGIFRCGPLLSYHIRTHIREAVNWSGFAPGQSKRFTQMALRRLAGWPIQVLWPDPYCLRIARFLQRTISVLERELITSCVWKGILYTIAIAEWLVYLAKVHLLLTERDLRSSEACLKIRDGNNSWSFTLYHLV